MRPNPNTNMPAVPVDLTATLGGTDGMVPAPWRATYVISVSMTGGLGLLYAIDHAAMLPWCWGIPVGMRRRQALAHLVVSSGILRTRTDETDTARARRSGAWLCASTGSVRRALPLAVVAGGEEIAEAFRAVVPASVWQHIAERRTAYLATHDATHYGRGLRGTLDGEDR
jgi:hypothetical protein